eukprot:CAMPEP_0115521298 /NCGR_PEP_ID=MMETSP0271-20121206/79471_1 /TAXON_ID=71861 /ORGANISM="Scrippsiella trochoidea, Strain CCMP3099" /LENGTH=77 /DNA_ID=CAMNT_0002952519 /DNA_START=1 /DNA_END=231 /DNA_ORIENTATION=-
MASSRLSTSLTNDIAWRLTAPFAELARDLTEGLAEAWRALGEAEVRRVGEEAAGLECNAKNKVTAAIAQEVADVVDE